MNLFFLNLQNYATHLTGLPKGEPEGGQATPLPPCLKIGVKSRQFIKLHSHKNDWVGKVPKLRAIIH